jgi:hypothetical protein
MCRTLLAGGQNDNALARRLELADALANERGDAAFGRVLAERSLGQRGCRQAPGSTLVLAAREGSHALSAREGSHLSIIGLIANLQL